MAGDIRFVEDECGLGLRVFRVKGLGQYAWLGICACLRMSLGGGWEELLLGFYGFGFRVLVWVQLLLGLGLRSVLGSPRPTPSTRRP